MKKLTITSAFKLGEKDEQYGQTWLCSVKESKSQVMFNLMSDKDVREDDRITWEEQSTQTFKTGKRAGEEYQRLKKVRVESANPQQSMIAEPDDRIGDILGLIKEIHRQVVPTDELPTDEEVDEEVDLSDIPF